MEINKEMANKEEKGDTSKLTKTDPETSSDLTEKDFNELNNDISKMLIEMKKEKDFENENIDEDEKETNNYELEFFSSNNLSTVSMDVFSDNSGNINSEFNKNLDIINNDQTLIISNPIITNVSDFSKVNKLSLNTNMENNNSEDLNKSNNNIIKNEIKLDTEKNSNVNSINDLGNSYSNNNLNQNKEKINYTNIFGNINDSNINNNQDKNKNIFNNNKDFLNKNNIYVNNFFINNKCLNQNNTLDNKTILFNNNINLNINNINQNCNFLNMNNIDFKRFFTPFSSFSVEKDRNEINIDSPKSIIHIDNVLKGKDKRTSLIIRNIPNGYTISKLLREINKKFYHKYDVVYLPKNNANNTNLGYGFINFIDYMHLAFFYELFEGKKWNCMNCNKRCQLAYSKYQGKDELLKYIQQKLGINSDFNTNDNLKNSFFINDSDKYTKPLIEIPIKYFITFKSYYPFSLCHSKNDKIFVVDKF